MTKRIVSVLGALVMIGLLADLTMAQDNAPKPKRPAPDVRGRVKSFNAETGELVVVFKANREAKPEDKTVKVTDETKIMVANKEGGKDDLKAKAMVIVFLTTDADGNKTDTAASVRVMAPRGKDQAQPRPKRPAPPKEEPGEEGGVE